MTRFLISVVILGLFSGAGWSQDNFALLITPDSDVPMQWTKARGKIRSASPENSLEERITKLELQIDAINQAVAKLNESLVVRRPTSPTDPSKEVVSTTAYRVSDLPIWNQDKTCDPTILMSLIESAVSPEAWEEKGGSTVQFYPQDLSIIVSTTSENHKVIQNLLKSLRSRLLPKK
ncbi:MAG: hypothetical protein AAF802_17405 [Planctomycetota bacterium]